VKDVSALIPVTKDTVDAFAKNWEKWLRSERVALRKVESLKLKDRTSDDPVL